MADHGDVHFGIDLSTGLVNVTVRAPLMLPSTAITGKVSMLDFIDFAAKTTLELNRLQRDAMAALGRGELVNGVPT